MSSFVVQPKTINRVVSFLDDITSRRDSIHKYAYQEVLAQYRITLSRDSGLGDDEKTLQKFVSALWDLNIEAVHQRYGDEDLNQMPSSYEGQKLIHHKPFEYTPTEPIQAYKSLQCLIYQCSEGNVPNNPLYKMLEELESTIAKQIVYDLSAYDKAEWD